MLSDEIYHGLAYEEGSHFYPFADIVTDIPVIKVGGISKIYGVPGWRLGWIIVYNRHGFLTQILDGMGKVTTIWLHPNSLVQFALPKILKEIDESFHDSYRSILRKSSVIAYETLKTVEGLDPIKGKGAMYMMCRIKMDQFTGFADEVDFCQKLLAEENVFVLPSKCFFA